MDLRRQISRLLPRLSAIADEDAFQFVLDCNDCEQIVRHFYKTGRFFDYLSRRRPFGPVYYAIRNDRAQTVEKVDDFLPCYPREDVFVPARKTYTLVRK